MADGGQEEARNVVQFPRGQRYLATVDEITGKVSYLKLQDRSLGKGWSALYDKGAVWLAKQNLPNEQYRVWLYLQGSLDFDNYITVSQKQIANELGMKQPAVSRAIKGLVNGDILQEGPRGGMVKSYRLNPRIAHKGKNLQKTVIEYDDLRKRRKAREQEQGNEE